MLSLRFFNAKGFDFDRFYWKYFCFCELQDEDFFNCYTGEITSKPRVQVINFTSNMFELKLFEPVCLPDE